MNTQQQIVQLAAMANLECWSHGTGVSEQTKKSSDVCKRWQALVKSEFAGRFTAEKPIARKEITHRIDLVDEVEFVAYELKVSRKNVHAEIYRDVFKVLVFNRRNPGNKLQRLVFIAPQQGIEKLNQAFVNEVQAIVKELKLELILEGI